MVKYRKNVRKIVEIIFSFWFYRWKQRRFKKYTELWDGIKSEIETINGGKKGEYGKDFMKVKFNTHDNLSLNKVLKLHMLTIIVRCIFEDGKFYLQFYLNDCLYEV